ncbi:lactate utilization protein [Candidatus Micrarchaeota archaeon]|nr:lactate utilization protein [Candidatus Micrarchaeota archaeon]
MACLDVEKLSCAFEKRQIEFFFCANKAEANAKIFSLIEGNSSVGWSGSQTLVELGVLDGLRESAGEKKLVVFDRDNALNSVERARLSREGANADYFLASANAVVEDGRLLVASAFGNRIAGVAFAKKKTIVVVGRNKLVRSLDDAFKRLRSVATPLNCKRLNWDNTPCFSGKCNEEKCCAPEFKRMCGQVLITEFECVKGRMAVILVDEELGF